MSRDWAQNGSMTSTYVPGVCNIGPAERRKRKQLGWVGVVLVVVGLVCFVVFDAPAWVRVIIAIPAAIAANGFLQSAMHFCVGFAMRGLYNLGTSLGTEETVMDAEQRRADQKKGALIMLYSVAIAAAVAVIAVLLP